MGCTVGWTRRESNVLRVAAVETKKVVVVVVIERECEAHVEDKRRSVCFVVVVIW